MSRKLVKCATCGSWIDTETEETLPPTGDNAKKITQMMETIVKLESAFADLTEKYEKLLKEKGDNGNGKERKSTIDDII